jgi:hypothetical protein
MCYKTMQLMFVCKAQPEAEEWSYYGCDKNGFHNTKMLKYWFQKLKIFQSPEQHKRSGEGTNMRRTSQHCTHTFSRLLRLSNAVSIGKYRNYPYKFSHGEFRRSVPSNTSGVLYKQSTFVVLRSCENFFKVYTFVTNCVTSNVKVL